MCFSSGGGSPDPIVHKPKQKPDQTTVDSVTVTKDPSAPVNPTAPGANPATSNTAGALGPSLEL